MSEHNEPLDYEELQDMGQAVYLMLGDSKSYSEDPKLFEAVSVLHEIVMNMIRRELEKPR